MTADTFTDITLETIQSQYSASPSLVALIKKLGEQLNPRADMDLFYEKYFNPATAEGVGLDCWGRIVGVGRKINVDEVDFFGFQGQELQPFNQEPFYHRFTDEGAVSLDDEAYRRLIFYKAMANISDSSVQNTNRLLLQLMRALRPDAECYVQEVSAMRINVVFLFELSKLEQNIFETYGLLNVGTGVQVTISQNIQADIED